MDTVDMEIFSRKEKAEKFLMDVMGKDIFRKFLRDGKIEIKSGKYIYELTVQGTIINKTTNQLYCITLFPGVNNDIPLFDLIAIKYSWLKYNNQIVEKVANKRNICTEIRTDIIHDDHYIETHDNFVRYMETHGWMRRRLTVNESHKSLVGVYSADRREGYENVKSSVVEVRAPAGRIVVITGKKIQENAFIRDRLGIRLASAYGKEIPFHTPIEIVKDIPNGERYLLRKKSYSTIRLIIPELFTFRENVILYSEQRLIIRVIGDCDIDSRYTRLYLDLDLWVRVA